VRAPNEYDSARADSRMDTRAYYLNQEPWEGS
jgi:hypothetical protein